MGDGNGVQWGVLGGFWPPDGHSQFSCVFPCLVYAQTVGIGIAFKRQGYSRPISNPLNRCNSGGIFCCYYEMCWAFYQVIHFIFSTLQSKRFRLFMQKGSLWEFPGGPVVRTWRFQCPGPGSIPGQGTKIPPAAWHGQEKKKKAACVHWLAIHLHGGRGPWEQGTILHLQVSYFPPGKYDISHRFTLGSQLLFARTQRGDTF